ncbi:hypothetical protein LB941_11460 [Ligilactobacillus sp. WILCCON 0076]|uniref:DUF1659 domain-containing protein n=1 Tax=Ligilactobacillus ubinensis TaxID=2876789 RepID=A0A9X2FRS2_9LACO|nr:hypothetical protein [Ligilactobacillus ubinensis]MCP0887948.1 hypothetical protein [Ligilactobacillus ubinensis]
MMEKAWKKKSLKVEMQNEKGDVVNRTFNNIVKSASDENIIAFSDVVGQLTGETVKLTAVTDVNELAK